ncbi:methionyl-tRNA formyltransferase [Amphibiibacter pelophylacis]|uniref:Methionyl-tRNA formyltransferase n=1 Tax=Amphibiibacter pelophylacis TaxID=1799477 RepID=A0ACC6P1Q7_9BURK
MRIAFAGTPEFAAVALRAVLAAAPAHGWQVPLVLTQPDRPAGRGLKLQPSPVKQVALAHGLTLAQPISLRLDGKAPDEARAAQQALQAAAPDVWVVAAYGLLLPRWALELPRLGCLNIHGSLLPRWRGAAPIQRAIEAGDAVTGVGIMQMEEGLDTGPVWLERHVPIGPQDSAARLHDALAEAGAQALIEALTAAQRGWRDASGQTLQARVQPTEGTCYAAKISKAEAQINWREEAAVIERRIRAFDPAPGCYTPVSEAAAPVKIWRAQVMPDAAPAGALPGEIIQIGAAGWDIACGSDTALGVLRVQQAQKAGGKRQDAATLAPLLGLQRGQILGAQAPDPLGSTP